MTLIVQLGPTGYGTALALVETEWDYSRAALRLAAHDEARCRHCRTYTRLVTRKKPVDWRCPAVIREWTKIRQRIHRFSERVQSLMGPSKFFVPVRRRAVVSFGTDSVGQNGKQRKAYAMASSADPSPLDQLIAKEEAGVA